MIYQPQWLFKNKHFNTVYRTIFHGSEVKYNRKRILTQDDDFIDIDFARVGSNKIVIVLHGLEGSSNSNYITTLCPILNSNDFDVVVVNLRGCSGEPNLLLSSYHSGKSDDLDEVISHIDNNYTYMEINIVGYSLGGNIVLKYLGENKFKIPSNVKSAVTISVPSDLKGSSEELAKLTNVFYMQRFLKSLKRKAVKKLVKFPNAPILEETIIKAKNFYDFDNVFTAPIHGFKNALDYWKKSSSKQFIGSIKKSTLLITSLDDPFLTASCVPIKEAKENKYFKLEVFKYGGHVGFNVNFRSKNYHWLENRILKFLQNQE